MKEVYLLRHGEKDTDGTLTEDGVQAAQVMGPILPRFVRIISSDTDRTTLTAKLLTGEEPHIDDRAAYATTSSEISNEIDILAKSHNISFLDAARLYNNPEVLAGIDEQADALNTLIDQLLEELPENGKALIVSHDLTIAPAMGSRNMPAASISPLGGYVISMDNEVLVRRYPQLD